MEHGENVMKLSSRERMILDKLAETVDVGTAASALGISPATIYNVIYRLRKKQREARIFLNQILNYRKKSKKLARLLAPKVTVKEVQDLIEEVEEEE
jgi:transcriptional antiterminator